MPVTITRRLPQAGRIRIGRKGEKGQPLKLETFRLTSPDYKALQEAAQVYGGKVTKWGEEWELITTTKELPVYISPEPISQWWEEWSAGGCKKRCDGAECQIPDGQGGLTTVECSCDPNKRTCGLKTRVSFLLPDLPGLAIWRLDTGSYFAAAELPDQLEILQRFKSRGQFPEANLCLSKRKVVRQDKDGKAQTRIFPVISLRVNMGVPLRVLAGGEATVAIPTAEKGHKAIEATPAALPPAPANVDTKTGEIRTEPKIDHARGRGLCWSDLCKAMGKEPTVEEVNAMIDGKAEKLTDFTSVDMQLALHNFKQSN